MSRGSFGRLPEPYGRLLVPVYVPSFLMALSQDALLVLLPLYVLDLGMTPVFAALAVGLRGVGVLLFDVPAGMLVSRMGEKPVLLLGLAAVCAGLLLLAMSPSPWIIAIAAVLLGIGFAAWMLGRQSYIAATCETRETGRAIAMMAGIQRGGAFVGPAAGGLIAQFIGYPFAFLACAVCAACAGFAVFRYAQDIDAVAESDEGLHGTVRVIKEHAGVFATAGVAALVLQLMRATRQLLVPLFGQSVGLDVAMIGAVYSLSAAIDMSLFYPIGVLVDRRGRKWSAVPAMVLFAIGLSLLPFADGLYSVAAVAILLGLANGCGTGIVMILGADLSRRSRHRSQFLGVWRVMGDTGMSSAPLLTGVVINFAGLAAASGVVAALGFAGAAVMVFWVAETNPT